MEIKFREDRVTATMMRLDETFATAKLRSTDATLSAQERATSSAEASERYTLLAPIYRQLALHYVDLHDRVGRMEAKQCAQHCSWREARRFFYQRLRRRLAEFAVFKILRDVNPQLTTQQLRKLVSDIVAEAQIDSSLNLKVAEFLESSPPELAEVIQQQKGVHIEATLTDLLSRDNAMTVDILSKLLPHVDFEAHQSPLDP